MDMQLAPLLEEKYDPTSAAPSIVFFGVPQILMSIYPFFFPHASLQVVHAAELPTSARQNASQGQYSLLCLLYMQ
jgi:hypothetical protein